MPTPIATTGSPGKALYGPSRPVVFNSNSSTPRFAIATRALWVPQLRLMTFALPMRTKSVTCSRLALLCVLLLGPTTAIGLDGDFAGGDLVVLAEVTQPDTSLSHRVRLYHYQGGSFGAVAATGELVPVREDALDGVASDARQVALAHDPFDRPLVATLAPSGTSRVFAMAAQGGLEDQGTVVAEAVATPTGLAVDRTARIAVVSESAGRVYARTATGDYDAGTDVNHRRRVHRIDTPVGDVTPPSAFG